MGLGGLGWIVWHKWGLLESWFSGFKNEAAHGNKPSLYELMKAACFAYIEVLWSPFIPTSALTGNPQRQYLESCLVKRAEMLAA